MNHSLPSVLFEPEVLQRMIRSCSNFWFGTLGERFGFTEPEGLAAIFRRRPGSAGGELRRLAESGRSVPHPAARGRRLLRRGDRHRLLLYRPAVLHLRAPSKARPKARMTDQTTPTDVLIIGAGPA